MNSDIGLALALGGELPTRIHRRQYKAISPDSSLVNKFSGMMDMVDRRIDDMKRDDNGEGWDNQEEDPLAQVEDIGEWDDQPAPEDPAVDPVPQPLIPIHRPVPEDINNMDSATDRDRDNQHNGQSSVEDQTTKENASFGVKPAQNNLVESAQNNSSADGIKRRTYKPIRHEKEEHNLSKNIPDMPLDPKDPIIKRTSINTSVGVTESQNVMISQTSQGKGAGAPSVVSLGKSAEFGSVDSNKKPAEHSASPNPTDSPVNFYPSSMDDPSSAAKQLEADMDKISKNRALQPEVLYESQDIYDDDEDRAKFEVHKKVVNKEMDMARDETAPSAIPNVSASPKDRKEKKDKKEKKEKKEKKDKSEKKDRRIALEKEADDENNNERVMDEPREMDKNDAELLAEMDREEGMAFVEMSHKRNEPEQEKTFGANSSNIQTKGSTKINKKKPNQSTLDQSKAASGGK